MSQNSDATQKSSNVTV